MIRKAFVAALCLAAGLAQAASGKWTITDLGVGPNPIFGGTYATNLNNRGDVTGWAYAGQTVPQHHAFVWSNGTTTDLGVPAGAYASEGNAINNKGTVAGSANNFVAYYKDGAWTQTGITGLALDVSGKDTIVGGANFGNQTHAFMIRDGAMIDLGTLNGGFYSIAYSVNDKDVVAGFSYSNDCCAHAMIWENGTMRDLGTLGGSSYAYDINSSKVAVGVSFDRSGHEYAVAYDGGVQILPVGGTWSLARSINDHGDIVGSSSNGGFLYSDGAVTILDQLSAVTSDGWKYLQPVAINDRGWIVGHGVHNGSSRSFLLMPK
jgi:probable HAF family extracellular repeat protein